MPAVLGVYVNSVLPVAAAWSVPFTYHSIRLKSTFVSGLGFTVNTMGVCEPSKVCERLDGRLIVSEVMALKPSPVTDMVRSSLFMSVFFTFA